MKKENHTMNKLDKLLDAYRKGLAIIEKNETQLHSEYTKNYITNFRRVYVNPFATFGSMGEYLARHELVAKLEIENNKKLQQWETQ